MILITSYQAELIMKGRQSNEHSATKVAYIRVKETAYSYVELYQLQNASYSSLDTQNYSNSYSNIYIVDIIMET